MSMKIPNSAKIAVHGVLIEDYVPATKHSDTSQKTTQIAQTTITQATSQVTPKAVKRTRSFVRGGGIFEPILTGNSPSPYNTRSKKRVATSEAPIDRNLSGFDPSDDDVFITRQDEKKAKKLEPVVDHQTQTTSKKKTQNISQSSTSRLSRTPMTAKMRDEKLRDFRSEIYSKWASDLGSRATELSKQHIALEDSLEKLNPSEKDFSANKKAIEARMASYGNVIQDKIKKIVFCEQAANEEETPDEFSSDVKSVNLSAWKALIGYAEKQGLSIPCDDAEICSQFQDEVKKGIIFQEAKS